MKKNSALFSSVIFLSFILSFSSLAHAALVESSGAGLLDRKGSIMEGTAAFFSDWLKPREAKVSFSKVRVESKKIQKANQESMSELNRKLSAYSLFSSAA